MIRKLAFKALAVVLGLALVGVAPTSIAFAQSDHEARACAFVAAMTQSPDAVATQFEQQATYLSEADVASVAVKLRQQLVQFEFQEAAMYPMVDLATYKEFFIIASSPKLTPVFFRLSYALVGEQLELVNFIYNTDFDVVSAPALGASPAPVPC
ncbi:MAG: hypothetical protein AAFY73_02980 [Pseudomonadota bacterium]